MLSYSDALAATRSTGMSTEDTTAVLDLLLDGALTAEDGGELLRTWAARGETGTELAATVRHLRGRACTVPVEQPCFDVCGTGGSGLPRFNISTTVAFIAAAAAIPVAKHGNRGSRRGDGSFDLLEALGIPFDLTPEQEAHLQATTGICFLFARSHHPAVGAAVPYRKAAGGRTIFNLAGPLANPAPIGRQMIGCIDPATARVVATAIDGLGTDGALVVHGEPGVDEISITGATGFLRLRQDGSCREGIIEEALHPGLDYATLPSGEAEANAATFHRLLDGRETGPLRDMLCVNAGAAIDLWHDREPAITGPGYDQARELLASGAVRDCFQRHRAHARQLAGL